jgi:hypothetical protein
MYCEYGTEENVRIGSTANPALQDFLIATEGCPLLCIREMRVRPGRPAGALSRTAFLDRYQEGGVGCELEGDTRRIDVTRGADSIGEGISV